MLPLLKRVFPACRLRAVLHAEPGVVHQLRDAARRLRRLRPGDLLHSARHRR